MSRNARTPKPKADEADADAAKVIKPWQPDPSMVKIPAEGPDALTGPAPYPFDEPRTGRVRILKDAKANKPRQGGIQGNGFPKIQDMLGEPHDPDSDAD